MTRVSSDVDVARMFLSAGMALLLRTLLMVIGSLAMMLVIDWRLGLIMVAMLIISGSVIFWFLRVVGPLFSIVQQKLGKLNTLVQENLAGVHVVKAFVREQYEIQNFDRDNVDYMEQNIKVGRYLALVDAGAARPYKSGRDDRHLAGRHRRHRWASYHRRTRRLQQLHVDRYVAPAASQQHPLHDLPRRSIVKTRR